MTRRQELIYLIESFKNGIIDLNFFCKEFYRVYFMIEKDNDKIPQTEDKFFKELAFMCARYSDNEYAPNAYYSEKDMTTKIGCWGKSVRKQNSDSI